jgi:hypothetical protein
MIARRPHGIVVALAVAVLLLVTVGTTLARWRSVGPGCPGNPDELIAAADDGDVITILYQESSGRNTNSALITRTLEIEGGWVDPSDNFNCGGDDDGVWESREDLLAAGLLYDTTKLSGLTAFGDPVLRLDDDVKRFDMRNIDLLQNDQASGNGAGLTVSGATATPRLIGATITLTNVTFKPNYFSDNVGATGNGGGLYLDLDGGSQLTLRENTFREYRAGDSGGGFYLIVRGNSSVLIEHTTVQNNTAASCGGGKLLIYSGTVTISDSNFSGNTAGGKASDLCIERAAGATGTARVFLRGTTFGVGALSVTGDVVVYDERVMLPLLRS